MNKIDATANDISLPDESSPGESLPSESLPGEIFLPLIPAGYPQEVGEGCGALDVDKLLRVTPRSFALRVRGQSMIEAGIQDGDVVVGEFKPTAQTGAIVVALIDGESTLKRLVIDEGQAMLASENPAYPNLTPLCELVVQGVVHTLVRRLI